MQDAVALSWPCRAMMDATSAQICRACNMAAASARRIASSERTTQTATRCATIQNPDDPSKQACWMPLHYACSRASTLWNAMVVLWDTIGYNAFHGLSWECPTVAGAC